MRFDPISDLRRIGIGLKFGLVKAGAFRELLGAFASIVEEVGIEPVERLGMNNECFIDLLAWVIFFSLGVEQARSNRAQLRSGPRSP